MQEPGFWDDQERAATVSAQHSAASRRLQSFRKLDQTEQLGRNDPCWCGSGKKFKKCHGA